MLPRPFAAGDDVAVTLKRTAVPPTTDQALWVAIRNSTNAIGFDNYTRFLDVVLCGERPGRNTPAAICGDTRHKLRKVKRRTALPFPNVDRYRLLKAATEVFLMIHCGVDLDDFSGVDLGEESRRLNRTVQPGDLEAQMREYLVAVATGQGDDPGRAAVPRSDPAAAARRRRSSGSDDDDEAAQVCHGIIAERLTNPCFLELLWSYWHDEGGLVQTLERHHAGGSRTARPAPPGRDPLAGLDIDPLRPLSNLLWGWIQDTQHRLTMARRAYEYDHQYGLVLVVQAGAARARRGLPVAVHRVVPQPARRCLGVLHARRRHRPSSPTASAC